MTTATEWLQRIRALPLPERIKVMNVCGGHERSITTAGLRKAIPSNIEIVPGPGCPVCICPEEDIYEAIQLAAHAENTSKNQLIVDILTSALAQMPKLPPQSGEEGTS